MIKLPYDPSKLERELRPYYLGASDQDINLMLQTVGHKKLSDLYSHMPDEVKFKSDLGLGPALKYQEILNHVQKVAAKNKTVLSFLGDGLPHYKSHPLVPFVCDIRGLTTAYTPYQPERSQGTLHSLWVYSNMLSKLTGFEAVNASLYDRSTALFEGLVTACRVSGKNTVLISMGTYPEDREVVETMAKETKLKTVYVSLDEKTGLTDQSHLKKLLAQHASDLACVAFQQVNSLGLLEEVDALTDLAREAKALTVAVIDPILLATDGLKRPADFGSAKLGVDFIVGDAQHLALQPNFGGPGLGLFGVRYNDSNKNNIRATPGRYIGKAKDNQGNDALAMVLSTREQHIRREKATSNICSNQSFVATIVGAAILGRGEKGMTEAIWSGRRHAFKAISELTSLKGIELAFPQSHFFNEIVLKLNTTDKGLNLKDLLAEASRENIHLGLDVSARMENNNQALLMLSFTDNHNDSDLNKLQLFMQKHFGQKKSPLALEQKIPNHLRRSSPAMIPTYDEKTLRDFYTRLGELNVSPDDNVYPLGSCTMKYNPYINDFLAGLPEFTKAHPKAPEADVQGCLQVLFDIQTQFKKITGLPAVTTQPVAGAQGEIVGLKLFQAYHLDRGEKRDIILIPKSAHGTNPASATVAGYETKNENGIPYGIVTLNADKTGKIDMDHLDQLLGQHGSRVAGIMITNPNTSGIFETNFHIVAKKIHAVGGLVYMDGANMNAIAGIVDLNKLGVDAVHNNLHKTWSIPHGGGGPGDAIVAVSEKLVDFLPGVQIELRNGQYHTVKAKKSIGSIHRHFGNFAHKVRAYTYLLAFGDEGIIKMSSVAVLSAVYLYKKLKEHYPSLPEGIDDVPRMHEFILTLSAQDFANLDKHGTPKAQAMARIGKLFLDFGLHAPTVAFPEIYGLMFEPTETYSKSELDRFADIVVAIAKIIRENPEVLTTVPHFTPVYKIDEVDANKNLTLSVENYQLPKLSDIGISPKEIQKLAVGDIVQKIVSAHKAKAKA